MMNRLPLLLLALSLLPVNAQAVPTEENRYVEISVNGVEQLAEPLDHLAGALEKLADSDKLSAADQQKLMQIMGELNGLSNKLDNSIQTARHKVSEAQQEIADSIQRLLWTALASLVAAIGLIATILFVLIKRQVAPLVDNTGHTIQRVADTVDQLSHTAEFIAEHQPTQRGRRFARRRKLIN